jgi:hypothetical protein
MQRYGSGVMDTAQTLFGGDFYTTRLHDVLDEVTAELDPTWLKTERLLREARPANIWT